MRHVTIPISSLDTHPWKFITVIQLANYLGVTRRTLYNHIEKGALRVVKRVGVVRIHIDEARRYARS